MRVVEGADHTFTRIDASDRLRQLLLAHPTERYGGERVEVRVTR